MHCLTLGSLATAITLTVAAVAVGTASPATAARPPTLRERAAITAALPVAVQRYPIGCVYLGIVVSTDARYSKVTSQVFYPQKSSCLRYAANGWYILRKDHSLEDHLQRLGAAALPPRHPAGSSGLTWLQALTRSAA